MFPLNDTEPNRYSVFPFATVAIISANVLAMAFEYLALQSDFLQFRLIIHVLGITPSLVLSQQGAGAISSLTALFLHGGLFHLLSNMSALWVFGRRVEDACGHGRFLFFYLACGVFANIVSTVVHAGSSVPSIGASGAVFGVMGAYLLLFPGGRIRTLVFLSFVPTFPRIRAFWIVLYFLVIQLPPAFNILINKADYTVGYWAHLGGFLSCLFVFCFLRPEAFHRYWSSAPV